MKLLKWSKFFAPVLLLLAFSTLSFAGIAANGSFGFSLSGCCSLNGGPNGTGNLLTASTIDFQLGPNNFFINTNDPLTYGLPNDFQFLASTLGTISPNGLNTTIPFNAMTATFGAGGIYSFTALSEAVSVSVPTRSINFYFLGTFADSTNTFDSAAASLTLQFSQSAPNTSLSGSGTLSTPPAPLPTGTPEPATMGVLGTALVGLGIMGRKKLARP
jgi:hypothetical protein